MKKIIDFKKEYKELYSASDTPKLINVPQINFLMADGVKDPNNNPLYQEAVEMLYSLSYAIKMSKMKGNQPEGYYDYIVPPLEGLWWIDKGNFNYINRENWLWTTMIMQPEFVTEDVLNYFKNVVKLKKPNLNLDRVRLNQFKEGKCVQILHNGSYSDEPKSIALIDKFIKDNNLINETGSLRKHHEIYLNDPSKTPTDKLKTIIRLPVKEA